MNDKQLQIVVGGLLHDIGKVVYRSSETKNHSECGYDFLKNENHIEDQEILNQVRYHHVNALKSAKLNKSSSAYITYVADNISSAMDRREKEEAGFGFIKDMPLESVFNIFNQNHESKVYSPSFIDVKGDINYPTDKKVKYTEGFYAGVKEKVKRCLAEFQYEKEYVNSLLAILESTLSFVPSSTAKAEVADISLYDHMKMTAAVGSCIYAFAKENGIEDYEEAFLKNAKAFYEKKTFLIYSMDVSGIQDFIYTISSKGALKGLRARSFYLEIMMEHLIDELLDNLELTRANLIYSGGGHAYIIAANTKDTINKISAFEEEVNEWFLREFQTALYVAGGFAECSAKDLQNQPEGSYTRIFQKVSEKISEKKMARYSSKQILQLNRRIPEHGNRECIVCRRSDRLRETNVCGICWALEKMSGEILTKAFFTVTTKEEPVSLPLPGDKFLITDSKDSLLERMERQNHTYVRSYSKNEMYSGYSVATRLWVGDYVNGNTFEDLAHNASGIKRIAVLRADVDNLGQAFVHGFDSKKQNGKYVTLSRTATFSRKLSMFFKYHINSILENPTYSILDKNGRQRNALIVYSGGDDVFLVGSWDDVIEGAIDLYESLQEYTQNTLTISAGIGLYPEKYPISVMAEETGRLEDCSKSMEGKNAVTVFDEEYSFHWDELINGVLEEKLRMLQDYLDSYTERGNSFLYHMLELIRGSKNDRINIARYAYLLGRIAPEEHGATEEQKEVYQEFSRKMYSWIKNSKDVKELELAIYIYVYLHRDEEGK